MGEGPVAEIFGRCPSFSAPNCEQVAEGLSSLVEPLSDDAVYQNDMSKRCTAGSAVSYICKGQEELLDLISGSFSDAKKNHFYKQIEACKVGDEDGDGPHCGEIIPNVYLYHEAAITYLAMGYCPTTADPTSSPGVLCDPVHNPVTGQFMFYKVGYFNSDTMMETPPDCMPAPVDAMP